MNHQIETGPFSGASSRSGAALCLCLAVLFTATAVLAQGAPASVTPIPNSPISSYVNTVMAGHWFQQRGNGTANVATNYDFVNNTFQDSPALRVHGKPFAVAFWYRSTQTGPFRLLWENGEVGANTGYVVGLHNGYMAIEELNTDTGCSFTDWLHGSIVTNDGNWHHAAIIADRNNTAGADAAHTYIYTDGVLDGTLPYCDPADNTSAPSNQWYGIGRNSAEFDYAGDVDHFTAWVGTTLTADEVKYHMQGGLPQTGNVGVWYEFENANGQRVPDKGANHYDGHVSPDATPLLGPAPALQALVRDASGNPVPGVEVTFRAPRLDDHDQDDAGGTFLGGYRVVKVTTDASGVATAPTFTANEIPGSYFVIASVAGVFKPAVFPLSNLLHPTATTLSASPATTFVGQPITFTATVLPTDGPAPTGTVRFRSGAKVLGTATLDGSGQASLTTSSVPAGKQNVVAQYLGDSLSATSSANTSVVVKLLPTTTTLTSSTNPSSFGQAVTFTVAVTSTQGTPGGIVALMEGKKILRFAILNSAGQGAFSISTLSKGSHNLSARYAGSWSYEASSSAPLTQTVQ